ncbi:thioesterase domain-containing protein, partial [Roseibium polysiphoniae]|uniref:thioesterase domain-containing protein n=1 Tax=Roseibium polysiphoniae TaxID=2571221 RepID=UPI003297E8B6
YLEQILKVCPVGPYRLAGWSFGANVAHAIAALIQEARAKVELLAMIDGYPYAGSPPDAPAVNYMDDEEDLESVRRLHFNGAGLDEVDDQRAAELATILAHSKTLAMGHDPFLFDGDILFFGATGHSDIAALKPAAWQPYITGAIKAHQSGVEHHEMMQSEPQSQIGAELRAALAGLDHS